jgi:hypothetical protein
MFIIKFPHSSVHIRQIETPVSNLEPHTFVICQVTSYDPSLVDDYP